MQGSALAENLTEHCSSAGVPGPGTILANGATKTLPESWKFDLFSLADYKQFWIYHTTLCYIHFFSCLEIQNPLVRM